MKNSKQELVNLWLWVNKINRNNHEKGNTLILAMGIGLVLVIITSMALINSSKDKTNTTANESTKQGIAIAEAGVTQTVNNLNGTYSFLLKKNYDPATSVNQWDDIPDESITSENLCESPAVTGDMTSITQGTTTGNGSYTINKYVWNGSNLGSLELTGNKSDGLDATSKLQVDLEIGTSAVPDTFPGFYAETVIDLKNNKILSGATPKEDFAIICADCSENISAISTDDIIADCQDDGEPDDFLLSAVGANNPDFVEGSIYVGATELPPYPAPPTQECSDTQAEPCYILISGTVNSPTTFPRPSDVTDRATRIATKSAWSGVSSGTAYTYILGKTDDSLKLTGTKEIIIDSSIAPVKWYVAGNIDMVGGSFITHTGTLEKFSIFGCTSSLNTVVSCLMRDASGDATQSFTIAGGASTSAMFIYAPNTIIGINGGSASPDFNAVIWADTWNGSASTIAEISIPPSFESLLSAEFSIPGGSVGLRQPSINKIKSWQRKAL